MVDKGYFAAFDRNFSNFVVFLLFFCLFPLFLALVV